MAEVSELDDIEFPEAYLTRPTLVVAVGVSHRVVEGEAWGRYVVMLLTSRPPRRGS